MQDLVDEMSIKELKRTIADGGMSHEGCTDKQELRALALQALEGAAMSLPSLVRETQPEPVPEPIRPESLSEDRELDPAASDHLLEEGRRSSRTSSAVRRLLGSLARPSQPPSRASAGARGQHTMPNQIGRGQDTMLDQM